MPFKKDVTSQSDKLSGREDVGGKVSPFRQLSMVLIFLLGGIRTYSFSVSWQIN